MARVWFFVFFTGSHPPLSSTHGPTSQLISGTQLVVWVKGGHAAPPPVGGVVIVRVLVCCRVVEHGPTVQSDTWQSWRTTLKHPMAFTAVLQFAFALSQELICVRVAPDVTVVGRPFEYQDPDIEHPAPRMVFCKQAAV